MRTVDHPWQQGKKSATQFSMPSLKEANGPAVMFWCQSRAWKCNHNVSFSYTSPSSGSQFWPAKRKKGNKNNIGLILVIPVFLYLGILIAFICPSSWLQNVSSPSLLLLQSSCYGLCSLLMKCWVKSFASVQ